MSDNDTPVQATAQEGESTLFADYTAVEFRGNAGEYFRIWIVNIALTIVTLGIYSAWATVRNNRYFYTNTYIQGNNFDFHAKPVAILIGRVISMSALGLYFLSSYIHPFAPPLVLLAIFAAIPWLVVRSRIFRMRNTSLRGVRFNFEENYSGAFKAYYVGALVTVLTLGVATPTAIYWRNRFAIDNSAFGQTPFDFEGKQDMFYAIIYKSVGLLLLAMIGIGIFVAVATPMLGGAGIEPDTDAASAYVSLFTFLYLLVYLAIGVYVQVRIRNYIWNKTTLGENTFLSTLSASKMFTIYLTNIIAIVVSLGLLVPWAKIRVTRYRAENTEVKLADNWESYLASGDQAGSALGDELGEAFDVGVDVGF